MKRKAQEAGGRGRPVKPKQNKGGSTVDVSASSLHRMTSITRKLHWSWIRKQTAQYLGCDLFFYLLFCIGWCADQELTLAGSFVLKNQRSFYLSDGWKNLIYQVRSPEGEVLVHAACGNILLVLTAVFGSLFLLQTIGVFLHYIKDDRHIRRLLAPLNEIALKADELSRLSFSEDKYQMIEEAIEHIQPGAEDAPLSFQDEDLAGIEAAMNNLLLRMRDTYRQQARFVNDASHELRTPIAVIQGYANMLDRWGKTDETILDESIQAIKNESGHMNHLVEQLLFLARGDSGKTTLNPEAVPLSDLIREVYEESFMIDETHVYRLKSSSDAPVVQADSGLLKQAVRILVDNASKYTPAGGEILLGAGITPGGEPYLQVQDSGTGIAEEELPHIFERFYRSDEVRSSAGTGLGLSIAKWIVDKHRGHFEILSRTGLGTRIRIVLSAS